MTLGELEERIEKLHNETWNEYRERGLFTGFANFLVAKLVFAHKKIAESDAEIARLQAENAKLREFAKNVSDWVANPEEKRIHQRNELDALLLATHKESAEELLAELEESEANNEV